MKETKDDITKRMAALRRAMLNNGLKAYIVTGSDPHLSEYVQDRWKTRQWLSGFTGSAGTMVVTGNKAVLWTDSRYFLQAEAELAGTSIELYKDGTPGCRTISEFIVGELDEGSVAGVDGLTYSAANASVLRNALAAKKITLYTAVDLFDKIWHDRPEALTKKIAEIPDGVVGQSRDEKLKTIRERIRAAGANALLLTSPDEVCWTFNLRGSDIKYTNVQLSYAFISEKEAIIFLYTDETHWETRIVMNAQGLELLDYNRIIPYLSSLSPNVRLIADINRTPAALIEAIPKRCRIINDLTPVNHLKSVKNGNEINGFIASVKKDGVALTRFYMWLEQQLSEGNSLTEISVSDKLLSLRKEAAHFRFESFEPICAYNEHAAIVHYNATPETDAVIRPEGLLLMDTGAHYLDGTTDITRTITLSDNPSQEMKEDFTRVLKGHIALASCKFPAGTRGSQLDVLARKALWDVGLNYGHGTGHGVGHVLCVHEGPQSIRAEENPVPLLPGMILSNEPGLYRAGKYGIRIENMMLVHEAGETDYGLFLSFETISLCFIDTRLIDTSMLSAAEIAWLNRYHRIVYDNLSPLLKSKECQWLKAKTEAIQNA
ncbi:MAG: aminopeptidase P family protein [Tannerellaceae bacterium]|jgi:Xaa-Pro aminopeptidase|nr:aminopeptidase P family protein [Tannerellaceae bacterium]